MKIEHLKKKGGARFTDVETYKVSCLENKILAQESFKSANEVTSQGDEDTFVHVVKGILTDYNEPVVVKVHHANNYFIQNELQMMERLEDYPHVVQQLCNFKCQDDTKRWMKHIKHPTSLCVPRGPDHLHYIVMEYIENGDVHTWFRSNPTAKEIKAFVLQAALIIAEMAYTYKVYHGDLNSGNILIERTSKKTETYTVNDTTYRVKTHGVVPKLIDFGRGEIEQGKTRNGSVLSDIYILLSVLCNGIKDQGMKDRLQRFVMEESQRRKNRVKEFIERLRDVYISR